MTAMEAIHEIDSLKPNSYSQEQKLQWLDRLDAFLQKSILNRYPARKAEAPAGGDPERQLLLEAPFDEAYLHWLESKIHYYNEELDRYNASVAMFRGILEDFQRTLHQKEVPENPGRFRF